SVLVSSGWMTPQYCSPEQAKGQPLSRKTDIWSWGVSVLEMFNGEVTWHSGQMATETLEEYLREREHDDLIPAMPAGVVEVLGACFQRNPAKRWVNLADVVEKLKEAYWKATSADYSPELAGIERRVSLKTGIEERCGRDGATWRSPRNWLEAALRVTGDVPADAAALLDKHGATRSGQLVVEVAFYEEVKRIYERYIRNGRKDLECDLAGLCMDKAVVHWTAADSSGTLREYDQAIAIWERMVNHEGRLEFEDELARACLAKATFLEKIGDASTAMTFYDRGIVILERLACQPGSRELPHGLELINALAGAFYNKGNATSALGDNRAALDLYNKAIAIRERLVNEDDRHEFANGLARVYMCKGLTVGLLGDVREAIALQGQAVSIFEKLVNEEGHRELAHELATAYFNRFSAAIAGYDAKVALTSLDHAVEIWERLVEEEGRREFEEDLARAYMAMARTHDDCGSSDEAIEIYDHVIEIRERLVNQEGRRDLTGDLGLAKGFRALALLHLGEMEIGMREMLLAQTLLEAEIARTDRADLKVILAIFLRQAAEHSA
ncbi:MAG: tetratricopeptide repeat protein, partial [Verrucomicrobia subdivision 3 bacterium]|nr:tetratricopeptide repeat protein [Limisphaerales bacterium]